VWCEINYGKASLKSQLKKADKMSSQYVFIIGDDEIKAGKVKYKRMSDGEEGDVSFDDFDSMIVILTNGNK
jgi:histidyl-tRNA synthetase